MCFRYSRWLRPGLVSTHVLRSTVSVPCRLRQYSLFSALQVYLLKYLLTYICSSLFIYLGACLRIEMLFEFRESYPHSMLLWPRTGSTLAASTELVVTAAMAPVLANTEWPPAGPLAVASWGLSLLAQRSKLRD